MQHTYSRQLLPLVAVVAVAFSIAACGDRTDRPQGARTTAATSATTPATTTAPPANTAAPTTGTPAPTVGTTLAAADREFFTLAASSDMLEVETGRLALDKSKNANVRTFAQKMVDDRIKANESLRQVASSLGVTPPTAIAAPHAAHLEQLRGLSGTEFDREYAAQIGVAAHQEAVALFERASREAANADARALAEKTLPTLREQLQQGQTLAKNVGVPPERMKTANAPPDLSSLSAKIPSGASNTTGTTGSGATSGADVSKGGTTTSPAAAPVDSNPPDTAKK